MKVCLKCRKHFYAVCSYSFQLLIDAWRQHDAGHDGPQQQDEGVDHPGHRGVPDARTAAAHQTCGTAAETWHLGGGRQDLFRTFCSCFELKIPFSRSLTMCSTYEAWWTIFLEHLYKVNRSVESKTAKQPCGENQCDKHELKRHKVLRTITA